MFDADQILGLLDRCVDAYSFPLLDNGYVYLADSRLSLFRSDTNWALVIEIFGYSPRSQLPDVQVHTFASRLHNRRPPEVYSSSQVKNFLRFHPNDEVHFFQPLEYGAWIGGQSGQCVDATAGFAKLRGQRVELPSRSDYIAKGIQLREADRTYIFELCRYLAGTSREEVLATPEERRVNVLPSMAQILQLDDWHHPDVAKGEKPGDTECFRQLAQVLETGVITSYRPTEPGNTHWRNWPEGGSL